MAPRTFSSKANRAPIMPLHIELKTALASLAKTLSGLLGSPVVDRTGLLGMYDFKLDYTRHSNPLAGEAGSTQSGVPAVDSEASISTAVQELGIKLEGSRGPVEVMVIDHADHRSKE